MQDNVAHGVVPRYGVKFFGGSVKKNSCIKTLFCCALLAVTSASLATDIVVGTVRTINVNQPWGGIFIQLDGAPTFGVDTSCAMPFAFVPVTDLLMKQYVALALAAKMTGTQVRISTTCATTAEGQAPHIQWMDYEPRL
jgi:hypothetical protein